MLPPGGSVRILVRTEDERRAIESLQRLARRWPDTLYLASMGGSLHVMRKGLDGEHVEVGPGDGLDPRFSMATVDIDNTGGDW
jgi:hypothetical protein